MYKGKLTKKQSFVAEKVTNDLLNNKLTYYHMLPGQGKIHIILSIFDKLGKCNKLALKVPNNMVRSKVGDVFSDYWDDTSQSIKIYTHNETTENENFVIYYRDDCFAVIKFNN